MIGIIGNSTSRLKDGHSMSMEDAVIAALNEGIDTIRVMTLSPGDTLILSIQDRVTMDIQAKITEIFRELFPEHKVLILDSGVTLGIIHNQDTERDRAMREGDDGE